MVANNNYKIRTTVSPILSKCKGPRQDRIQDLSYLQTTGTGFFLFYSSHHHFCDCGITIMAIIVLPKDLRFGCTQDPPRSHGKSWAESFKANRQI